MKYLTLAVLATSLLASSAFAYMGRRTDYYCEGRGAAISVVSDTRAKEINIVGTISGNAVNFWSKKTRKDDVMVFQSKDGKFEVQVQPAGPYDGGQDALWGSAADDKGKVINMTCYIGLGSDF